MAPHRGCGLHEVVMSSELLGRLLWRRVCPGPWLVFSWALCPADASSELCVCVWALDPLQIRDLEEAVEKAAVK